VGGILHDEEACVREKDRQEPGGVLLHKAMVPKFNISLLKETNQHEAILKNSSNTNIDAVGIILLRINLLWIQKTSYFPCKWTNNIIFLQNP